MTMKFSKLTTHWEPEEALCIIVFLDELREVLWNTYGDSIVQQQRNNASPRIDNNQPLEKKA